MANFNAPKSLWEMDEQQNFDIPYDSEGFIKWLTESAGMEERDAEWWCDRILLADLNSWSSRVSDPFNIIYSYINDRERANEYMRVIYNELIIENIAKHIVNLENLRESPRDEDSDWLNEDSDWLNGDELELHNDEDPDSLNDVIKAYKLYLKFMENSLGMTLEEIQAKYDIEDEVEKPEQVRYKPVPLDTEFKKYLDESKYTRKTRDKMLSNLRKLNTFVIDNGRGDSKWLENMVEKASRGENILSKRLIGHKLVQHAISYAKDFNVSEDDLRGGMSALNAYIRFLIYRQKHNQLIIQS